MPAIALLESELDKRPRAEAVEWPGLVGLLTTFDRRAIKSAKDGAIRAPAWIPASMRLDQNGEMRRGNVNVDSISYVVIDIDEDSKGVKISQPNFERICSALDTSGTAAIVHSSFRFSLEHPKARVVFRPSRAVLPGENLAVRAYVAQKFGIYIDPSTKDPTRLYYLPAAPEGAPVFAAVIDGADLNVDEAVRGRMTEVIGARATNLARDREEAIRAKIDAARASGQPIDIEHLRGLLLKSGGRNAALLKAVAKGERLADEGGRDNALNAACSAAVFALPPETPIEILSELFRPSIEKFERKQLPSGEWEDWAHAAISKFERALERRIASDAARDATNEEIFGRLRLEASKTGTMPGHVPAASTSDEPGASDTPLEAAPDDVGAYSSADLAEWARQQGCRDLIEFSRRWVITRADSFYLFVEGQYLPPIPRANLEHSIVRDLIRAPVELFTTTASGQPKLREVRSILHDYSTVARNVEASLSLQTSFYEPASQTFFEATTPLRKLTPRFHTEIDLWLRFFDPSLKLLDWVATVSRLDRQTCAIYIDGVKGVGKTLLPTGLARLWTTGGPSEMARVLDGFNDSLITCPLVFADEALPQRKGITAELRRFIGSTKRTLARKFLPNAQLEGAVRVILAANNDRLLDTGEELSAQDLDAIAERIYYIKPPKQTAQFLIDIGGPPRIEKWISGDMIAEHALWLRANRKVNEGARFLVEGNPSEFHRHLATGSGMASLACEWLARWLADPNPTTGTLVRVGLGELWVNTEAMAREVSWSKYVPATQVPTAARLGRALRSLASGSINVKQGLTEMSYHRLEASLILTWVDRLQIGDLNLIHRRINAPDDLIAEWRSKHD